LTPKLYQERTPWAKQIVANVALWQKHAKSMAAEKLQDGIHPAEVVACVRELMEPEDLIGADTGAIGSWVGSLFPVKAGKTMVRSNGSLGWVVPGVMGAALARPRYRAVAVSGDGGLLYHIGELKRLSVATSRGHSCAQQQLFGLEYHEKSKGRPRCFGGARLQRY
jgi:acetolactate synthase-1/2/3 large subunit